MKGASFSGSGQAGSLHIVEGAPFPKFLQFDKPLLNGWASIANARSPFDKQVFDEQISKAGWICFFLAGKIETAALGFSRDKTFAAACERLARKVKSGKYNGFEILEVTTRQFWGIFRVNVSGHARHFRQAPVCFGH
jgi:hypothetical protein